MSNKTIKLWAIGAELWPIFNPLETKITDG